MQNTWLKNQLDQLKNNPDQAFVIEEALRYIQHLEDDNESLQVALEGEIWSPNKWNEKKS